MRIATQVRRVSAGVLPVPRLGQRPGRLGPRRVEPAVQRRVLLHPQVGGGAEVVDATAQVDREATTVLTRAGGGRFFYWLGVHRDLFGQRAVGVGDADGGAGVL